MKPKTCTREDLIHLLGSRYQVPRARAARVFDIAVEFGRKAEPVSQGYLLVTSIGGRPGAKYVTVEPALLDLSRKKPEPVAPNHTSEYSRSRLKEPLNRPYRPERGTKMPAKRARTAPEPATEEVEETAEKDYTVYADKDPTATMSDFAEWIAAEVYSGELPFDEEAFNEGVRLGGTLRMEFQRSDFCKERRAERKANRAAGADEEEEEAEESKPTRRAKPVARKPATAKPATAKPAAKAPPRARRGGKAAASAEAPY